MGLIGTGAGMGDNRKARPVTWNDALARHAEALRAAGRAPGTVRLYRHYLLDLAEHHRSPWSVGLGALLSWIGRDSWGVQARKSARTAVCSFYRWAHGMGYLPEDPSLGLPAVSVPPKVARPAPELVVRTLIRDEHPPRIVFMSLLAAELGMRAAEIARVHAEDYTDDGVVGELLVHGKGGKERLLPVVSDRLRSRLRAVEEWAFPNGRGTHLTPGHVSRLLSAALPHAFTGHQLRHRCATVQYGATRDLLAVGAFLGHTRPETTQAYVKLPDDALRAVGMASAL